MRYLVLELDGGYWEVVYQSNTLVAALNEARQTVYTYPDVTVKVLDSSVEGFDFR